MSRKDFLGIQGVGPVSLRVCERLLGRALPPSNPDERLTFWLSIGIQHRSARALARAGICTPGDLNGKSREDLERLSGVGPAVISRLEELQGKPFPRRSRYWIDLGLPSTLSKRLVRAGIHNVADFAALTRESFLAIYGMGETSLELCQAVAGRPLRSPLNYWLTRGVPKRLSQRLVALGILNVQKLSFLGPIGLRRLDLTVSELETLGKLFETK